MKLHDEHMPHVAAQFGIVASEYADVLANLPNAFLTRMESLYCAVKSQYPTLLTDEKLKLKRKHWLTLSGVPKTSA